jgi:hypothetical protein
MGRLQRRTGKWRRATHLGDRWAALDPLSIEYNSKSFATPATPVVSSTDVNNNTIDLYSIEQSETTTNTAIEETPFVHNILIFEPKGEARTVRALFDGGVMVSAMSTTAFNRIQHRLDNTT